MQMILIFALALVGLAVASYRLLPAAAFIALARAAAGLRPRSAEIHGFTIAYLEGGRGEPLVLLHGIGADKDNWTYVAGWLTRRYRVIAPDIPGFGESSRPAAASYDVAEQVERLRQFLRTLGVERAHFGGNSMGGLIAAHYALLHPDEVQSLWLLSTAYVASAPASDGFERLERGEKNPLFAQTLEEIDGLLRFVMERRPLLPPALKRKVAAQQVAHYATNLAIFEELRSRIEPLEQRIAGLATPTLIVWGDRDRVFHPASAAILASAMPRARAIVLPGVGHVPMIEAPLRTARDYLAFRRAQCPESGIRCPSP